MTGEKTSIELHLQTIEDDDRWIHISMIPYSNDNNQLMSIFGTVSDITKEYNEDQKIINEISELIKSGDKMNMAIDDLRNVNAELRSMVDSQNIEIEDMRNGYVEYSIISELINYTVLRYDIPKKTIRSLIRGSNDLNFLEFDSDVPENSIKSGYVAVESVDKIREFFEAIKVV